MGETCGAHGTQNVQHARGGYTVRTAYAPWGTSCPVPPVRDSTQEAGTRSPYVGPHCLPPPTTSTLQCGGPETYVSTRGETSRDSTRMRGL